MNKKKLILLLVLVMLVALIALSACTSKVVDLEDYMNNGENGKGNLSLVGKLVAAMHGWIGNYGVTVIIFTVMLKIVTLPLDFWQRYAMRKSSLKMQALQPVIDEIDRNYGNNAQRAQQEKQKLYKQQSVSSLASCLPMIVTMAVFIFMFNGLNNYATYNSVTNYNNLRNFYNGEYDKAYEYAMTDLGYTPIKASEYAIKLASEGNGEDYIGIGKYYTDNIQESFLWIANIWEADTWTQIMPTYDKFTTTVKLDSVGAYPAEEYNLIRNQVLLTHNPVAGEPGSWNGWMILPLMSVGLSFLSIFVTQRLDKKNKKGDVVEPNSQQAMTNKTMMFIMPAMMAFFGFMYTGAFAIYMVCNYTLSIVSTIALKKPIEKMAEKSLDKNIDNKNKPNKANYMR